MADPDPERAVREAAVRARLDAGDAAGAATATIELYGAELVSFLHAVARDEDLAAEAYAMWCEDLWKGLAGFRWTSSLRTWVYALARNALYRLRRAPRRRERGHLPLDLAKDAYDRAQQIRTATVQFLRTEVKDEVRRLREALEPEDHELLILRIDRKMSWREVAQAMPGAADEPLDRRAAVLRKRFERAKALLRALAAERGLLTPD
ncbi:MAG: sigma-70 family RNA polymerase sigma factor [Myxococcales bacterium]|nr:sigma-70 family RNA polymerase sigma factor [Myxococcales bacterium]